MHALVPILWLALPFPASQGATAPSSGLLEAEARVLFDWRGSTAGEQFGWVARNAGDVNGDGLDDVITSAPFGAAQGLQPGRVLVYSGADGELLFEQRGSGGEQLGFVVCGLGDLDGDGHDEFAAGAPQAANRTGRVLVWSGADGKLVHTLSGLEPGSQFGASVCSVGDLDADGVADLAVAAPGAGPGVVLFYSGAGGEELGALEGERDGDEFGTALGSGDWIGSSLLVIGARQAGEGRRGRAYVYDLELPQPVRRFVIEAEPTGVDLGRFFVSVLGDLDGDGTPDVYAADFTDGSNPDQGGRGGGRFYVHSGASGERLLSQGAWSAGEGLGIGDARAGDVDGDGHADLIVGAWTNSDGGAAAGKAYLVSGADFSVLRSFTSTVVGEAMGFDATGIGDLDGDGVRDLLLTGAYHPAAGPQTGRVVVISGRAAAAASAPGKR